MGRWSTVRWRCLALALVAALGACTGADDDGSDRGGVDGGADGSVTDGGTPAARVWLRDERGGVLILRGTNVENASKSPPDFLPTYGPAEFAQLHDELGMDAIRLLVFWEAVEPEEGAYDDAYLAEVRTLVEEAGAAGLRVIVDMHQDVYGRGFGHDGAPRWTCDEALYDSYEAPSEWFLGYFEPEVMECFDRFWGDPDTRAAFGAAWARVAEELGGVDGLLAYELLNEPSWGSHDIPEFESTVAPEAYAEWIDAIRAVDPSTAVMIGPPTTMNVGIPSRLEPPDRPHLIYGPHLYPISLERGDPWTGSAMDAATLVPAVVRGEQRIGLPTVVGEVGARSSIDGAVTFLAGVFDGFDAARLGALQWEGGFGPDGSYALWNADGSPSDVATAIVRPYPARTAGVPLRWEWDGAGRFVLEWDEDGSATGDTLVSAPPLVFPDGYDAVLDDGAEAVAEGSFLRIPQVGGPRRLVITAR